MQSFYDVDEDIDLDDPENTELPPLSREELQHEEAAWPIQSPDEQARDIDAALALESQAPEDSQASPSIQKKAASHSDPYSSMLDQYRELLRKRDDDKRNSALLLGANQIGQAFAGKHSGNFKPDNSGIEALDRLADQPITSFESEQKMKKVDTDLMDMTKMRDPTSMISEFYRTMAKKRGLEVTDDMSAWDLAQMQKVMGRPGAEGKQFQQTKIYNPQTGQVETKLVNVVTGEVRDPIGITGYSQVVRTDPQTKELIGFNPGTGQQRGLVTGPMKPIPPAPTPERDEEGNVVEQQKGPKEIDIDRGQLNARQIEDLGKAREKFLEDSKDDRASLNASKSIKGLLETGKALDGDILRLIQNKFARASGEKGAMTEQDVAPYGGRQAVLDRINRQLKFWIKGQIPDDDRKFLSGLADAMSNRANEDIRLRSEFFTNNLMNDIQDSTPALQGQAISKKSVERLLGLDAVAPGKKPAPPGMVDVIEVATGRRGFIPQDQVDAAIKSKEYKKASP
jgi:hypothetical protein